MQVQQVQASKLFLDFSQADYTVLQGQASQSWIFLTYLLNKARIISWAEMFKCSEYQIYCLTIDLMLLGGTVPPNSTRRASPLE